MTESYDLLPFHTYARRDAHPARLATVAALYGLRPAPLKRCSVLELGCGTGGNIVPLAAALPEATFTGVDVSERHIAIARRFKDEAKLKNLSLSVADLTTLSTPELGTFDYIICHGVWSWVSRDVRDAILKLIKRHLAPTGVGYVSYNVYPGWGMKKMLRDMMRYHVDPAAAPRDRAEQGRELLEILIKAREGSGSYYDVFLKQAASTVGKLSAGHLFHDYLEEVNEPIFFREFAVGLVSAGLQYLSETKFPLTLPVDIDEAVWERLAPKIRDRISREQYLDLLRHRSFRESLLCHDSVKLTEEFEREIDDFYCIVPEGELSREIPPLVVSLRQELTLTQSFMTVKELRAKVCGASRPFKKLSAEAFREAIFASFVSGVIDLSVFPPLWTSRLPARPKVTSLARVQAREGVAVTSLNHEAIRVNELAAVILPLLDGTKDVDALVREILPLTVEGTERAELETMIRQELAVLCEERFLLRE